MRIAESIEKQLTNLNGKPIGLDSPYALFCDTQLGSFRCGVVGLDAFACQVQEIIIQCPATAKCNPAELKILSQSLADRLHYLLEPVAPIEFDGERAVLQMRSDPPSRNESQEPIYYELMALPGRLEMRRFQKPPGAPRHPIVMTFTREVFGRLATDMIASLAEMVE